MSANGTLTLTGARAAAAAALAPVGPDDPNVHVDVVDALHPPAILLVWDDPWLASETYGACLFWAPLTALCIAGRLEPGPGVEQLEQLVSYVIRRLHADAYPWPQATSQAPRIFEVAAVPYLGARVTYRIPVAIE